MYYLGIDIGGTKCAVSLGSDSGESFDVCDKVKFPTAGKTPYEVLDMFIEESEKLLSSHSLKFSDVSGLGISCGGPLDAKKGIVMSPPNLPGWDDIHVTEFFEAKTGILISAIGRSELTRRLVA